MALSARPIIRLRPREGRRVRAGAPWVFSNEIVMDAATKMLAPGTLVRLQQADGAPLGVGYFNPKSLIGVRMLSADPNAEIGAAFFAEKLKQALSLRESFFDKPYYRLVHAEGDCLPGLVIDRFGDTSVVQITTAGMEQLLDPMLAALDDVIAPANIVLRNDAPSRTLEGLELYVRVAKGSPPAKLSVEENGARYFADPQGGQKSGWYYDQRDNRAFMEGLARAARVLDAYCYTGGFGILAAMNGAREVLGLDSSEPALALAKEAADANGVDAICKFSKADVMQELERLAAAGEHFDIVICDPPPFVRARKDLEPGAKAYRKLARLAAAVTAPGGFLMLCSCSHNIPLERFMAECAGGIARAGRTAALIRSAGAGTDHPVHPMLPESAYLKALAFRLQ
jgi:23S rRNA (cytosine1962-C5)-methyltransferase